MANGYVAPVQAQIRRQDQGLDYQGKPGDSVVAVGLARVDAVKDDPGGFGKAVYYTLLDGKLRGQQIYVGHAQPTVTPGSIVQAGAPVATLLQHGLGNAANLAGWTEIGFAKNGAPEPGSSSRFASFVKGLAAAPTPANGSVPQQQQDIAQTQAAPSADSTLSVSGPPDPTGTHPLQLAPGSGPLQDVPLQLWRQIISQPNVSPDTLSYAQNASIAAGG